MKRWLIGLGMVCAAACLQGALSPARAQQGAVRWRRRVVAYEYPATAVAAADFNGDGRLDAASAAPEEIAWYERGAGSSFWRKYSVQTRTAETGSLAADVLLPLDMDGDGDTDLLTVGSETGQVVWFENTGKAQTPEAGKSWTRHVIDILKGARWAALEDLNRDGRPELVVAAEGSIVWYPLPRNPRSLLPASYKGDPAGRPIWERKFLARSGVSGQPQAFTFGDVDGDGDRDLCLGASAGAYFAWWERPSDGTLIWSKHLLRDHAAGASCMAPGDLDGDGKVDLLLVRGLEQGIVWLSGPDYKQEHVIDGEWLNHPHAVLLADLDRDGDLDVAAGSPDGNRVAWWENDGKGSFTRSELDLTQSAADIHALDIDGDGDLDLLVAGGSSRNVVWYENLRL